MARLLLVYGRDDPAQGWPQRFSGFALAASVAAAVSVGAMWGPWFRSGSVHRNSFGFFRAAQILGIEWATPFRIAWFLLPVLLPLALALLGFVGRRAAAAVLAALGLILSVAGGLSVAGFGFYWGGAASAVAGGCTTLLGVAMFVRRERA